MAKLDIFNPVWLDVVFTGRNQSYGAYVLRKNNAKTTNKALIIGALGFILLISSPLIVAKIKSMMGDKMEEEKTVDATEVILSSPPPVDEQAPPPPPAAEPPKPRVDQVRFPPPVVVPAEQVHEEEPPSQEELAVKDPGQKTIEGDPNAEVRIDQPVGEAPPTQAAVVEDNGIYETANIEVQPEFPGGIEKFYDYVGKNYHVPSAATDAGINGKLYVNFVVEKDGSLTDIKVVKDLGMGTGEEAIRVLKKSKKWNPGIQNSRPVRVSYTIPINITTQEQ